MTTLTDFRPGGAPDGDIFVFDVNGTTVTIERWATHNASGQESYTEDGKPVDLERLGTDVPGEVERAIEVVDQLWSKSWTDHIQPVWSREREAVIVEALKRLGHLT